MSRREHAEMIMEDAHITTEAIRRQAPNARIQMPIWVILEGIQQPDLDHLLLEVIPQDFSLEMRRMLLLQDCHGGGDPQIESVDA